MATLASIRSAIFDAFDTLTQANGYNYDYSVNEYVDAHDNARSGQASGNFPKISLDDTNGEFPSEELNVATMAAYSVQWDIIVYMSVMAGEAERTMRSKITADIQTLINRQDISGLSGNALRFQFVEGENAQMQNRSSSEKLIFSVETVFHRPY